MTAAPEKYGFSPDTGARLQRILDMRDGVFLEWGKRVRNEVKGAAEISWPVLVDTLPLFYDNLAEALAPECPRSGAGSNNTIASAHGDERARMTSYGVEQLIHEYQIFREAFGVVAERSAVELSHADWRIINRSLDAAVRESTRQFTLLHDEFRRQAAAFMTHDMRTPLSTISACAQIIEKLSVDEKCRDAARKISKNAAALDDMTGELLDILSFHQRQKLPLTLTEFDVLELARDVAAQASVGAQVRCVAEGEPLVGHWCRNLLRRALENLVANGIKYGGGGIVTVKIAGAGGRAMLTVHNQGSVIPKAEMKKIFQYLHRDNQDDSAGWGLGLPFVERVSESHGGTVALESSEDAGTLFVIDLPVDCRPYVD